MMKMMIPTAILASLAVSASAAPVDSVPKDMMEAFKTLQAKKHDIDERIVSVPMHLFKDECGTDAHLPIKPGAAALLQGQNVPGAGVDDMDKFKPFKKVLKDGFLLVDCVKDYMYYRGDKFGDNKHDYKLGPVSDVSIVHYDAFVAKEDRAEMTQKKCFEFCRTVPNMGFFGIVNGRGCYCTPYFKSMESDSSQCDAVCEGDKSIMCGGKSKSSVFAMHMCDSTADDLKAKVELAELHSKETLGFASSGRKLSDQMQGLATKWQKSFGAVGDSGATGLMQKAKVFAGKLLHQSEDAEGVADKLGDLVSSAKSLKDFTDSATVTKAERIMEGIDETWGAGRDVHDDLVTLECSAKGEHHPMDFMTDHNTGANYGAGASFVESQVNVHSGGYKKVGKDNFASPGPWFRLCDEYEKHAGHNTPGGCAVETCGGLASNAEECAGYYEHWQRNPEHFSTKINGAWQGCFCRTAVEFDESKQFQYPFQTGDTPYYLSATYKYELAKKKEGALVQYYPVMYFVDKKYEEVPTTCDGDMVANPIVGQSAEVCAAACDAQIHSCVAFQFFEDGKDSMCFLLSKFTTGFYYTGDGCSNSFLQKGKAAPFNSKCYAKLSKFQGTTLKPNPSGKCKQCFKDLTKANRCYK